MSKNDSDKQKKYDESRIGKRTRNWTVIFYPDDLPIEWVSMVNPLGIRWIQSPLHNKDFNEDGKPKKAHYHILLIFNTVKNHEQVKNMLGEIFGFTENNSIVGVAPPQQVHDRCALVRYMAHLDNPEKAQYSTCEIKGHNGAKIEYLLTKTKEEFETTIVEMEEFIEDNFITELSEFSKAIRYKYPEWHIILTKKMTYYFNAYLRSFRHQLEMDKRNKTKIDVETGEIIE